MSGVFDVTSDRAAGASMETAAWGQFSMSMEGKAATQQDEPVMPTQDVLP